MEPKFWIKWTTLRWTAGSVLNQLHLKYFRPRLFWETEAKCCCLAIFHKPSYTKQTTNNNKQRQMTNKDKRQTTTNDKRQTTTNDKQRTTTNNGKRQTMTNDKQRQTPTNNNKRQGGGAKWLYLGCFDIKNNPRSLCSRVLVVNRHSSFRSTLQLATLRYYILLLKHWVHRVNEHRLVILRP